ncbi:MAG: hypothetical protein U0L18_01030 [Acutalibacteraceae bacterium]|nr:hypothetical protein [Acutalibacteraceae bacterium]
MADSSKAEFAQIASTNNSEVSTNGGVPYVNIPVLSPYGIVAVPPKGTRAVVLPTGDTAVCLGVPQTVKDLKEGEIMLFSSGGASIILKNNGKVLINGKEM